MAPVLVRVQAQAFEHGAKAAPSFIPLTESFLDLGRKDIAPKGLQSAAGVSRRHCRVRVDCEQVCLQCISTTWVRRKGAQTERYSDGFELKLRTGDKFFLSHRREHGFKIESKPETEVNALLDSQKTPVKRKRDDPACPSAPVKRRRRQISRALPGKLSKLAIDFEHVKLDRQGNKTDDASNSVAGAKGANPLPSLPPMPQYLAGVHFCFWETANMRRVIQMIEAAGAVIDSTVQPCTKFIVAAPDIPCRTVAEKLGLNLETDSFPEGKFLVNAKFPSACNAERKLLDPSRFAVYTGMRPAGSLPQKINSQKEARAIPVEDGDQESDASMQQYESEPMDEDLSHMQKPLPLMKYDPPYDLQKFTGGTTGMQWGQGDIWLEPWSPKEAQETVERLLKHWHREQGKENLAREDADDDLKRTESSDRDEMMKTLEQTDSKCGHVACSKAPTCIISHLKELSDSYDRSGIDSFRRKAAENAMRKVKAHHKPLQTEQDVEEMALPGKTHEKVAEIVETGQLQRNKINQADSHKQTILLFAKVWGAAHKTAQRWYEDGCRTLDDVRLRTDLTAQQAAGLKHFEDLQTKIPAPEGKAIASYVKKTVLTLFGWTTDGSDAAHVRQMGSHLRGKPTLSDVDMLIMPPERDHRAPSHLLQELLDHLCKEGFITDDMHLEVHDKGDLHSASYLGFCKMQGSDHFRRVDIKIYPRQYLPYAVNYFTGSGAFNRALRFWANTAEPAVTRAKQHASQATGFKLSDTMLVPRAKRGYGAKRVEEILGQPLAGIACETDIFQALGLAYVPPHMRMSGDLL